MSRHDLVIFGATGFTGIHIISLIVQSNENIDFAVAGRNEERLKNILQNIGQRFGKDLSGIPIIIADSSDELSIVDMAKRAKVIINAVGPYRIHGEVVVKAAVENGASHVDISGEPAFLESMQMKYDELARKNGVYIIGACGWDSIPCDLGINFLKKSFNGQLNHAETFVQLNSGPSGYSFNDGTYQTLILSIAKMSDDRLGTIRRAIMPQKLPKSEYRPPKRFALWYNEKLQAWCIPFMGSDKSVVQRSQYFDYFTNKEPPVFIETYFRIKSAIWAILLMLWLSVFFILAKIEFIRKYLQKYPEIFSFNIFKKSGPTDEQIKEASFVIWFFGSGWSDKLPIDEHHSSAPNKQITARCDGPDAGYIATSACAVSAALTILRDKEDMPEGGGVLTTASAFKKTKIYDRLEKFGITFKIVENAF